MDNKIKAALLALVAAIILWLSQNGITFPSSPVVVTPPVVVGPPKPDTAATLLQKAGICVFPWSPLAKTKPIKLQRAFISNSFVWFPGGLRVEPIGSARTDDGKGLDTWLQNAKANGQSTVLCLNQTPQWFAGFADLDQPPVKNGADRNKPESYADYADFIFQMVARYGAVKHPDNVLRVESSPRWTNDPPNVKKSGLNMDVWFEVWNEMDKWWKAGTPIYMEPEAYAAFHSACYDASKKADPSARVVMAGLTGFDMAYLKRVDAWFVANRLDHRWPAGMVVNVHHYSNAGNELGKWPPTWYTNAACSPANDKDFNGVIPFVKFAKDRGVECWVSEFGYDTVPDSWMHPKPESGKTGEQLQSEWLIETYKAYFALGVDRCFMFNFNDEQGSANGGLYQSSGIVGNEQGGFRPKPSYTRFLEYLQTGK